MFSAHFDMPECGFAFINIFIGFIPVTETI